MKKIIFIKIVFILFLSFASLYAQWAKTYGGSYDERAFSIQQTGDGGCIVAGYTASFGAGSTDAWVLKLNAEGDIEWQKTYGGWNLDRASSIHGTKDGGYTVLGYTVSFGAGLDDIWVLKLDSEGSIEWQRSYGGGNSDFGHSIQQTDDEGYIVAGCTYSFGNGLNDGWILKLDSIGDIEWQHTVGGDQYDCAHSIQQTNDGGYIAGGYTESFSGRSQNAWIIKLDSEGRIEWQQTVGASGVDRINSIQCAILAIHRSDIRICKKVEYASDISGP